MIDIQSLKDRSDLLAIIGRDVPNLRRVANTAGGEYAGPCPFCGGKDRLKVLPKLGLWFCRQCSPWGDVLAYIAKRDNLDIKRDFAEICRRLAGGDLAPMQDNYPPVKHYQPAYAPPDDTWQHAAQAVITECESALWQPRYKAALDYLHGRGLSDNTIKRFHLGYCATGKRDLYGREIAGLWVPRGIVIPCIVAGVVWYLKIRLLPGVPVRCPNIKCKKVLPGPGRCECGEDNRYKQVTGGKTAAIFNADSLIGDSALICEGEFDAMIAHQQIGDVIACATLGSATNRPDLATWGRYLIGLRLILAVYDADKAGSEGAAALAAISPRIKRISPPTGAKDLAEYAQGGGDLWDWIRPILAESESGRPLPTEQAERQTQRNRLLDMAEAASDNGDLSTFARCWAAGMIAQEGAAESEKWLSWAMTNYGIPRSDVLETFEKEAHE